MTKNKKIAILYLAIGEYYIFWKDFYETAQKYLFSDVSSISIEFFVFTDMPEMINKENNHGVHVVKIEKEKFPYPTLKRYHYFLKVEELLEQYSYLYFFNANVRFLRPIGIDLLPKNESCLVLTLQPYTIKQSNAEYGYERREQSKAFIAYGEGDIYVWGAFNGGNSNVFLAMSKKIKSWIDSDLHKGIITKVFDESYLNRYILDFPADKYTIVSCDKFYVDGYNQEQTLDAAIHIFDKSKYLDMSFKEGITYMQKIKKGIGKIILYIRRSLV